MNAAITYIVTRPTLLMLTPFIAMVLVGYMEVPA